jgi:hypothetical protein
MRPSTDGTDAHRLGETVNDSASDLFPSVLYLCESVTSVDFWLSSLCVLGDLGGFFFLVAARRHWVISGFLHVH